MANTVTVNFAAGKVSVLVDIDAVVGDSIIQTYKDLLGSKDLAAAQGEARSTILAIAMNAISKEHSMAARDDVALNAEIAQLQAKLAAAKVTVPALDK